MTQPRTWFTALLASLLLHLALVIAVPQRTVRVPVLRERLLEVEVARQEVEPEPPPPPEPEAPPEPVTPPPPEPEAPPEPVTPPPPEPLSGAAAQAVNRALLQRAPVPSLPPPPGPVLDLPERTVAPPESDVIAWEPPPPRVPELPRAAPTPGATVPAAPDPGEAAELADALLQSLQEPGVPEVETPSLPRLEIEGPVGAERRVVVEPPFPAVQIRNPVEVQIRFWVSPRGEVIRALAEQRGDPEAERAALEYIRGLRFNPLPPGREQEQWGTIRITFRLE